MGLSVTRGRDGCQWRAAVQAPAEAAELRGPRWGVKAERATQLDGPPRAHATLSEERSGATFDQPRGGVGEDDEGLVERVDLVLERARHLL